MEWLGQAKINYTHSPDPISLKKKDGSDTTLLEICEQSTPPCNLNPLLFNGHLQTCWTAIKSDGPPLYYKRKVFEAENTSYAGSFCVDFVTQPSSGSSPDPDLPPRTTYFSDDEFVGIASLDSRPMLVALHGLSGGSYEVYLKHCLAPLVGAEGEKQWEACVVNSRGCAHHKITSSVLFNARSTWDCRQTVKWLRQKFPNRPLFGIGFSLGANILTNYVCEEGSNCELRAAVVLSSPWNLDVGSVGLQNTSIGLFYSSVMCGNLKKLAEKHKEQLIKNSKLDFKKLSETKYLHEFDRAIQCPTWGYPTEGAYYRDASSVDLLHAARIPIFAVNATDDPIALKQSLPYQEIQQTPYVILCTTSMGGHLSWFEIGGRRWHARPATNFLNKMAFEVESVVPVVEPVKADEDDLLAGRFNPLRRKWQM
ncbi:Alpha/Beta hydrolase protein [Calycina marina]|uniref:alcohol O-acetyltransferase n=1 Tax=Calycina marina TaxID=1763456 RepID=A0A9P7Z5G7_9HELO|nr:Alpha/Beta hydrolase protein [Calycina marina]